MPKTDAEWEKIKKDNQYRKDRSIAYFNSLNAAIALVSQAQFKTNIEEAVIEWRDFFIGEWEKWWEKENMPAETKSEQPDLPIK